MMKRSVKNLICVKELMSLPISDILRYQDMADSVDPEEAIRFLADMFIDSCGISLGMRGFADYCAKFWIDQLNISENPELIEKYGNACTLSQFLPFMSDKYYDGLLEEYDSCVMTDNELRNILIKELEKTTDEKTKTILCAGICNCLGETGFEWLERYTMTEIESGIINFQNRDMIRYRQRKDVYRYRTFNINVKPNMSPRLRKLAERVPDKFSETDVDHFIVLNNRLRELQHEVMDQVKVITANLQEQIAKGIHQYDKFCIDGYIYIEENEEGSADELFDILTSFAKYPVIHSNYQTSQEHIEKEIFNDMHWYANWNGIFHQLEKSHGLRFCRSFRHMFEEYEIFTIADIMTIKPEMFLPKLVINI